MGGSEGFNSGAESQSNEKSFAPGILAELVAKGLLAINSDRESMTLTINLQCDPNLLSAGQRDELKKFMEVIKKEFNAFKEHHHLSDDCVNLKQDEVGNIFSLRISLPTLALYDAFIQQLANNLLPTPNPKLQMNDEHQETKRFAPTPLSIEPKPFNKKIEDEELEIFNPSPFSTKIKSW